MGHYLDMDNAMNATQIKWLADRGFHANPVSHNFEIIPVGADWVDGYVRVAAWDDYYTVDRVYARGFGGMVGPACERLSKHTTLRAAIKALVAA